MSKKKNNNQEFHPYKINFISSLPLWFKANFFRWWIVGMAYYILGFGTQNPAPYVRMVLLGAIIGLLNSFFISYVIDQMSHVDYHNNPYISIRKKGVIGILSNIALSILILVIIRFSYDAINRFLIFAFSLDKSKIYLTEEPLGIALMYLGYDFLWRFITFRTKKKNSS